MVPWLQRRARQARSSLQKILEAKGADRGSAHVCRWTSGTRRLAPERQGEDGSLQAGQRGGALGTPLQPGNRELA